MKINKLTTITAVLLSFALLLAACAAGGDNTPLGTITLNFSRNANARAAAYPPDNATLAKLSYTVQLKGAASITAGPTTPGKDKISVSAPAGKYELTVTAALNSSPYAKGTSSVTIQAGKTVAVSVLMTPEGGLDIVGGGGDGIIINTEFEGDSIAAFKAWLEALPNNTKDKPYNVKLNIDSLPHFTSPSGKSAKSELGDILQTYYTKYVNLDLSGSTSTAFDIINEESFYICTSLTSIIIPNSVSRINQKAFKGCTSLTSVTIGNGVTTIGTEAFFGCSSLTSITIPNNVQTINEEAFNYCTSLTSVTLGNKVETIGDNAFMNCGELTSITIPASVTTIGDYAFDSCPKLTTVTFQGNSTSTIGDDAFPGYNNLKNTYFTNAAGTYKFIGGGWTKQP